MKKFQHGKKMKMISDIDISTLVKNETAKEDALFKETFSKIAGKPQKNQNLKPFVSPQLEEYKAMVAAIKHLRKNPQ